VCLFSRQLLSAKFLILRRIQRGILNAHRPSYKVPKRPVLMKLEFSRQIFEKHLNIKFHENPSSGTEMFHADGRTDTQTEGHDQATVALAILRTRL
jgi:hypothetical protein